VDPDTVALFAGKRIDVVGGATTSPMITPPSKEPVPVASQTPLVGHDTADKERTSLGTVGAVQVDPPSLVERIRGSPFDCSPTAVHDVAEEHDTALSDPTPDGTESACHSAPSSVL
jgi:hypothetical protein